MLNNRGRFSNKHRDAWVEINLGNLEHNVLELKKIIPENVQIMAVVKADAYGHGALTCAPTLLACGITSFGVASIDEALELRQNKITTPILVLGAVPIWSFESALQNDISISIFSDEHLEVAKNLYEKTNKKIKAHIKIDTGMNRIGIVKQKAVDFIKKVQGAKYLDLEGIFTHFADVENKTLFKEQNRIFENIIKQIDTKNLIIHSANSPAALEKSKFYNMARLGIVLYGLTPYSNNTPIPDLKQVIGLKGRITNIHAIEKNEGVSYGHKFVAKSPVKVATIPVGYADGVARALSGQIFGTVNGTMVRQIGQITMDQMMFDVTNVPDIKISDIITLLGEDDKDFFSINEWAKILNTINYELTCRLKVRLPRIYTRGEY